MKSCFNAKKQMEAKRYHHAPSTRQDKLFKYILTAVKANKNTVQVKQINKRILNNPMETN